MSIQHFGKGALRVAKNYTKGYSDVQAKVREATSNDPWGPSGTQMNEVAQMSYNQNDFVEIMEMLDKRLNDKGKNWRHVFKSLTVLDYLLHAGSENVVIYFRDNIYIIKTLKEFQYVDEYGKDQGANVRQKAKDITNLLTDENRLRQERRSRASMRDPEASPAAPELQGKNAGPTGAVLMIDANQVWDVKPAIEYVKHLEEIKPWFIEEPTAPDDVLGHAAIRKALKPYNIGVATGEHAHNRIIFKQLLQAEAIDVCQIDSCRLAGVSEVLSVLLMAAKFGVPVCPHAGGVGLCEYTIHLSLIDYIAVSGTMERNALEFVYHLHEHFKHPCTLNERARYNVPNHPEEGYRHVQAIEIYPSTIAEFEYPNGTYWSQAAKAKAQ
ncbi:hypothetical protein EWM64_g10241 [Hericium alpestre]|uniref:ENTH domain-containing protein n=1 Tax=Hericium alpestre TaxID=135208 RepID=A0A4Y9ZIU6_9AGAM|nr:hypothetical protein EWM64_g10241 [Hericium alpestre]